MAQTFRDFICECELYPYSKEHFTLMKECSELKLQEKLLENARFTEAAADVYTAENGYHLSEGYFQESVDTAMYEAIEADMATKKKGILSKIFGLFKKLLGKLAAFFGKIAEKLDKLSGNTDELLQKLQNFDITKDNVNALATALKASAIKIYDNNLQPFAKKLKFKYVNVMNNAKSTIDYYACILFADGDARILPSTEGALNLNDYNGLVEGKQLIDICNMFVGSNNLGDAQELVKRLEGAQTSVKEKGIKINVSSEAITNMQDALNNILKALDDKSAVLEKDFDKAVDAEKEGMGIGISANDIAELNTATKRISAAVAATISFYTALIQYKTAAAQGVREFLANQEGKAEADQNTEGENQ